MTPILNPKTALACAFPPMSGYRGALTTILDVARWGFRPSAWATSTRDVVRLIVEANMARNAAQGHGNRAERRRQEAEQAREQAELNAWIDKCRGIPTPAEIDELARVDALRQRRAIGTPHEL